MNEFTTTELLLLSCALAFAKDDETASRFKVLYGALEQKIEVEIKSRGNEAYLESLKTISNIDPDFEPIAVGMKKMFEAAYEMRDALKKQK